MKFIEINQTALLLHARKLGVISVILLCLTVAVMLISRVALSAPSANAAAKTNAESTTTLNFNDADITAVISAVSQITGMNFIIDPRVKGKVSIISNREMSSDEVYQVFLSVLKVHGFAAIPGKNITKIVPEVNAKQDSNPMLSRRNEYSGDEFVTRVITVKNVDASQLVPILRPLVPQRGHLAAYPSSNVLIISDSAGNIQRIENIIRRIDTTTSDEIEVIPLQYASAAEVVRIIQQLSRNDPKTKTSQDTSLVSDDRTNSILIGGPQADRLRLRALISHLDTPMEIEGSTHVVYLRNAEAKNLVPVLTGISKSVAQQSKGKQTAGAAGGGLDNNIVIQADESTNALVITAPPSVFRSLKSVIQKLDVRRAQVLVEAVIAEVSESAARELGVQWAAGSSANDNPAGIINFSNGFSASSLVGINSGSPPPAPDGLTFALGKANGTDLLAALIRALAADVSTNILSTPSLVTLDNEKAEIVVGQNVPFITGSFSGTGTGGSNPSNPFTTIQRQDVGLTLKVKPQINEGNSIKLDVEQEVSSIAASTVGADLITNKRAIKTSVMIEDGSILVLGGLIEETLSENEQRVPILGDIPILGWLFRYQKTSKVKTNLMVFIHPTIMKDEAMKLGLTSEKYNFIRAKQLAIRDRGVMLMADEVSPLLPEIKELLKLPPTYEEYSRKQGSSDIVMPAMESEVHGNDIRMPPPDAATEADKKQTSLASPPVQIETGKESGGE